MTGTATKTWLADRRGQRHSAGWPASLHAGILGTGVRAHQHLRTLLRRTAGATALEFALTAPVLIALLASIIEFGMVLFVTTLIEGGVREASRFGITGSQIPGQSREERIIDIIHQNTMGLIDIDAADIDTTIYPSFSDINQPEPFTDEEPFNGSYDVGEAFHDVNGNGQWDADMGAAGAGGPGDVIVYTNEYDWPLLTPLLVPFVGENGLVHLRASTAVRNEPFDDGGGG